MSTLLRLPQVMGRVGLKATRIYQLVGDGDFPAPIKLSDRAVAWLEDEVEQWIKERASRPRVTILTRSKPRASEAA